MMYWDLVFGVMVSSLMMIGGRALAGGICKLKGEVLRTLMPAALVVVKITAGKWVFRERVVS